MNRVADIAKLKQFRAELAKLMLSNESYAPIFLRLEQEIEFIEEYLAAKAANDLLERARAIARYHKAAA
jgi:hypothetical protein